MEQHCACCNALYRRDRYHPKQLYCGKAACQRHRRTQWQRKKLKEDGDYRANQAQAQARWRDSNRDYWKKYRASHPSYVKRNLVLLQQRRKENVASTGQLPCVAKMDVAPVQAPLISGRYRLEPMEGGAVAKMDVVIVQLSILQQLTTGDLVL